jgi:Coenzyme PQQ synthesis protein D (PqqD)
MAGGDGVRLDEHSRLCPTPHVRTRELAGDSIVLDLEHGMYFRLNATGSVVWRCLETGATLGETHSAIVERFEVGPEEAWNDLLAVVRELLANGLVGPRAQTAAPE